MFVNKRAANVVYSLPSYKALHALGRNALRATIALGASSSITCDEHSILCDSRCFDCGRSSVTINLLKSQRMCLRCLEKIDCYCPVRLEVFQEFCQEIDEVQDSSVTKSHRSLSLVMLNGRRSIPGLLPASRSPKIGVGLIDRATVYGMRKIAFTPDECVQSCGVKAFSYGLEKQIEFLIFQIEKFNPSPSNNFKKDPTRFAAIFQQWSSILLPVQAIGVSCMGAVRMVRTRPTLKESRSAHAFFQRTNFPITLQTAVVHNTLCPRCRPVRTSDIQDGQKRLG